MTRFVRAFLSSSIPCPTTNAQPAGAGQLAGVRRQPAHGARHRESLLGAVVWPRHCGDQRRLRNARLASHQPATAGLAGHGIHARWLEHEENPAGDGDLATFRQTSNVHAELQEKDPYNLLLARGPRFRMPAEMVRDVGAGGQWPAQLQDRRPQRVPLPARGRLGPALQR